MHGGDFFGVSPVRLFYTHLKGKEHPKSFFEIFKYVKVINERNTLPFTELKKLVSNSRYKPSMLTLLNHGRIVVSDVIGAEMNSLVSE